MYVTPLPNGRILHEPGRLCTVPRVTHYWIPGGALGVWVTVWHMRQLAHEALASPLLLSTARAIVGGASDSTEAATRIRSWLDEWTRFEPDPLGIELIKEPAVMLEEIECGGYAVGDCDDVAVLGASLGLAVRIPARFVLLAFSDPGLYEHVYTELLTQDGPVELDTTRPAQYPPGLTIARTGVRSV